MRLLIAVITIVVTLTAIRIGIYGFDFGLISVWAGTESFVWGRAVLDAIAGTITGGYIGYAMDHKRRVALLQRAIMRQQLDHFMRGL